MSIALATGSSAQFKQLHPSFLAPQAKEAMSIALATGSSASALSKKRSRPNLQVPAEQYKAAFYELLVITPPVLDMKHKLGPLLCAHVKQVTPGHLMAISRAWMPLIDGGCANLVLQSNKIQATLHELVAENSVRISGDTKPVMVPVVIDEVRTHIMQCATMMRALKMRAFNSKLLE